MKMTKEMLDCIDEAFNKAEKYEEIKYLIEERTDLNAYAVIEKIIDIIDEEGKNAT